jgi:deferrochelatase/peroxidase EfeB
MNLKKGVVPGLSIDRRHLTSERLSVLIGYGPNFFNINGIIKKCPSDLLNYRYFNKPLENGGGEVVNNSDLFYDRDVTEYDADMDHILLQFIADSEFGTSRAVTETWKQIHFNLVESKRNIFEITKIYTGFQSPDKRNWMGFLDGVSNIKAERRIESIAVKKSSLPFSDIWMAGGTYLAFMSLNIDLASWEKISVSEQELIIGRDKETGCPLIGIDSFGKPIKDPRCPRRGTYEVIERGNEQFREHPPFGYQKNKPFGVKDEILKMSHIGLTRPVITKKDSSVAQIYRQGFQFFDPSSGKYPFRVGLNFISFQKSTKSLFDVLKYSLTTSNTSIGTKSRTFNDFISVRQVGLFAVPPINNTESFPGETILGDIDSSNNSRFRYRLSRSKR